MLFINKNAFSNNHGPPGFLCQIYRFYVFTGKNSGQFTFNLNATDLPPHPGLGGRSN